MPQLDRRSFLGSLALAGVSADVEADDGGDATDVTRRLARYIISAKPQDLPHSVRQEGTRTLLNWVGCAVGGSRHETVDIAIGALAPFSGPAQASVLGRKERMDVMNAALMNGISSHIFDYDDTHLRTIIHPAGPVASAILALSEHQPVSGRDFCTLWCWAWRWNAASATPCIPRITTWAGTSRERRACSGRPRRSGKLLGLTEQQMVWALGLAATQPVGLSEMFGTMTKSFHPGRAAQNGLTAAMLASRNFTSSDQASRPSAAGPTCSAPRSDYTEITEKLGQTYEISLNTYKPFACGIVIHPAIDGCIQLRNQYKLTAEQIERIELRVHPLVLELTGKKTPQTGLEGQVQRVLRGRGGDCRRRGGREAVQRPPGSRSGDRRCARSGGRGDRPGHS